jgi:hydroxymethylglutaryl-CoA lyase
MANPVKVKRIVGTLQERFPRYPGYSNSFILKAGKCSDLHFAPASQEKSGY